MKFREGKSAASTISKRVRRLLLKCTTVILVLSMVIMYPACSGDFLGLDVYQRDLFFGLGSLAVSLLSPAYRRRDPLRRPPPPLLQVSSVILKQRPLRDRHRVSPTPWWPKSDSTGWPSSTQPTSA